MSNPYSVAAGAPSFTGGKGSGKATEDPTAVVGSFRVRSRSKQVVDEVTRIIDGMAPTARTGILDIFAPGPTTRVCKVRFDSFANLWSFVRAFKLLKARSPLSDNTELGASKSKTREEQERTAPIARAVRAIKEMAETDSDLAGIQVEADYRGGRESLDVSADKWVTADVLASFSMGVPAVDAEVWKKYFAERDLSAFLKTIGG